MSEMIIVECDYKDGECSERFEGFNPSASESAKQDMLQQDYGWLVIDGKHYCPKHREEAKQ